MQHQDIGLQWMAVNLMVQSHYLICMPCVIPKLLEDAGISKTIDDDILGRRLMI